MYSWKDTFALCAENRRLLENDLKPNAAVTCTRTFTILPLRYSAVGGTEHQRKQLPSLPTHLWRPDQVGELSESSYALRPLRPGFLYVLIKRKQASYAWHSQYRVCELGTLDFIDADQPWAPPASVAVGTAAGEALLQRWREAGISRANLFWRSLAQNQTAIEDEVDTLFNEQGTLAFLDPTAL